MNNNDTLIRLIQNLTQDSQDDTDPNNVLIQQFQSPYEEFQFGESTTITKWPLNTVWSGQGITDSFYWNQGGQYAQNLEVFKCLMLI